MTYRLPSLNGLKAFEAAARHLSFKTAAAELGVTPGAVSQQVKRLEAFLGVGLFQRLPHGLLRTKEAEALLPKVAQAFDLLTEATEAVAPMMNTRKFSIGICAEVWPLLPENWPRHNDVLEPYIRAVETTEDLRKLWDNQIDGFLRTAPVGHPQLAEQVITGAAAESLVFICRPGLMPCRQTQAILADLRSALGDEHSP